MFPALCQPKINLVCKSLDICQLKYCVKFIFGYVPTYFSCYALIFYVSFLLKIWDDEEAKKSAWECGRLRIEKLFLNMDKGMLFYQSKCQHTRHPPKIDSFFFTMPPLSFDTLWLRVIEKCQRLSSKNASNPFLDILMWFNWIVIHSLRNFSLQVDLN